MFTGIIERTGRVLSLEDRPGRRILTIDVTGADADASAPDASAPWSPAALGESIAVNGVCLTVVGAAERPSRGSAFAGGSRGEAVSFDAVPETLHKTTLGKLRVGDSVNIERSLRAGDRFGGHYVTGHVDGVGTVVSRRAMGDQVLFEVEILPRLTREVIPKGSVAVDGISLTVIDVDRRENKFSFAVIPHTLARTNLHERRVQGAVNVETDAFGKWVLQAIELSAGRRGAPADAGGGAPADDRRLRQILEAGGFGEIGSAR